jgi:hypothetical protein
MSIFEKKTKKDYSTDVLKVFDKLTINGNYTVIGSANLKKIEYNSDYDLQELIKEKKGKTIIDKMYHLFKDKFKSCKEDDKYFITDFKCGLNTDGEPLRGDYKDMMKGHKLLEDGRKCYFQECILIKTMMKMDMIVIIDGIFTEFSENYYIKIGNDANYFSHEFEKEHILVGIEKSLDEYLNVYKNYWKTAKRTFSLYLLQQKHKNMLQKLMIFFNSDTGLINKCKNELDILLSMLDNNFRKPKISDIKYNLAAINIWATEANIKIPLISKIAKQNKISSMYKIIEKLRDELYNIVNERSYIFLKIINLI